MKITQTRKIIFFPRLSFSNVDNPKSQNGHVRINIVCN